MSLKMNRMDDFDYRGKTVLLRVDINSPIDPKTKKSLMIIEFKKVYLLLKN